MSYLLPPNATPLEKAIAEACADIANVAIPLRQLLNPDTCPLNLLPYLANFLAVTPWENTWTEAQKRGVIRSAYLVHRQRGTLAALQRALDALGVSTDVVEWWQTVPEGAPYTFRVDVEVFDGMDTSYVQTINHQIDAVKPVRSSYTVRLIARPSMKVLVGTGITTLTTITIYPKP
jgi:phage tail P2-like protein